MSGFPGSVAAVGTGVSGLYRARNRRTLTACRPRLSA
jgi:hypothetical protein